METCQFSSLRSRHCRKLKETEEEDTVYIKKRKNPISATLITICAQLLNALQAGLHALCIVMRRGGECHRGTVLTSEEEGKFQSQTNAFRLPTAHKIPTTNTGNTFITHYHATHWATQLNVKMDKEKLLKDSTKQAVWQNSSHIVLRVKLSLCKTQL